MKIIKKVKRLISFKTQDKNTSAKIERINPHLATAKNKKQDYFSQLDKHIVRYKQKYANSPQKVALKLVFWNMMQLFTLQTFKKTKTESDTKDYLDIAIIEGGGIGDCLILLPWMRYLRKVAPCKIKISFYSCTPLIFNKYDFIDENLPYDDNIDTVNKQQYDLVLRILRYGIPYYANKEKIKEKFPLLLEYINKYEENRDILNNFYLVNQYGKLIGKNRNNQIDMFSVFGYDAEKEDFKINISCNEKEILKTFGLEIEKYITIARSSDFRNTAHHPKLWSVDNYEALVNKLKKKYPNIPIIQIGKSDNFGIISNADSSLVGKNSFAELEVILKNALLHIDGEGGLVHLRHFLCRKPSVVLFGPTSKDVFGYPENANIQSNICAGCDNISSAWSKYCLKGCNTCENMEAIIPEMVITEIEKKGLLQ